MGGKVFAESQLGEGTRINIDIGIKAIDTEFLQTQDQKSMSNQQKLSYLKNIKALEYFKDFWYVFEKEETVKVDKLSPEELT
jgi:hypothetical protein